VKWWKGALGLQRDDRELEQKSIIGAGDSLSEWHGALASRQDGTNFRTNTVTLADYQDHAATGDVAVLGLAAAWACINLLCGTQASLPLMVYRTKGASREVASDHPLYRVLHDSPNADQTSLDYWEFMTASIELKGNAYSEIERRNDGSVIALDVPLAPDLVQVRRLDGGSLEYRVADRNKQRIIPQEWMLHIRGFGGSPLGGLSTLAFGRNVFGSALNVERAASETFRQGARSVGAFVSDKQLSGPQMNEVDERITEKYRAAVSAGKPLILNNGFTWHALSINPDDAQMLESRGSAPKRSAVSSAFLRS
jgi:HK97 family phage portal protein